MTTTPTESHSASACINATGLCISTVATVLLLAGVEGLSDAGRTLLAVAYSSCTWFFWIAQMAYHLYLRTGRQSLTFRNVDRGSVLFLIAGIFTPLVVTSRCGSSTTIPILLILWGCAIIGMLVLVSWKGVPRKTTPLVSLVMATVGIVSVAFMQTRCAGIAGFDVFSFVLGTFWIFCGGAVYAAQRPNLIPGKFASHELYHAMVLVGTAILHVVVSAAINA